MFVRDGVILLSAVLNASRYPQAEADPGADDLVPHSLACAFGAV